MSTMIFPTIFGPTNVGVHRIAVAVELGDFGDAVRLAETAQLNALPAVFGERRSRYLLDVARAHAGVGDTDTATAAVREAATIAADEVRSHQLSRMLLPQLLARHRDKVAIMDLAQRPAVPV